MHRNFNDILIPGVVDKVVGSVPQNDVATSFRLVNRATRGLFSNHISVRLSQRVNPDVFRRHWLAPGATRALSRARRMQLVCLTAASGSIQTLEAALEAAALAPGRWLADAAAAAGQLETCQWLRQRGHPIDICSARAGHQHVCEWLVGLCVDEDAETRVRVLEVGARAAAEGGHLALFEWLLGRHPPGPSRHVNFLRAVAEGCSLAVLQRLHAEWLEGRRLPEHEFYQHDIIEGAARSRTPDWAAKLEWLVAQGYPRNTDAYEAAFTAPDALARLQWLKQRGYPMCAHGLMSAAEVGNVAALEFLLSEPAVQKDREDIAAEAASIAAECGHLAALQTLHARGCLHSRATLETALKKAVRQGHVSVAEWCLGQLGCPASPLLDGTDHDRGLFGFDPAASGSVEMLSWLQGQGVRWGRQSLAAVVESGCEEAVEWLLGHGCPMPADSRPYVWAIVNGELAMLRCLLRCGCPWVDGAL